MRKNLHEIARELASIERLNGRQFEDGISVCEFVSRRMGDELTVAEGGKIVEIIEEINAVAPVFGALHDLLTLALSDHRRDPRHRLSGDTHAALANRVREFFQHEASTLSTSGDTLTFRLESGDEFEIVVKKRN